MLDNKLKAEVEVIPKMEDLFGSSEDCYRDYENRKYTEE